MSNLDANRARRPPRVWHGVSHTMPAPARPDWMPPARPQMPLRESPPALDPESDVLTDEWIEDEEDEETEYLDPKPPRDWDDDEEDDDADDADAYRE